MLVSCEERRPRDAVRHSSISRNSSIYSREMTVRVIHAGGREEVYQNEILVSHLMGKYPGMCLATPEVFKNPQKSLLTSGEVLLPGHKYFLVPSTTIEKLKSKHCEKKKSPEGKELPDSSISSKDFYIPKEKCCGSSPKKHQRRKKRLVPPTRKQNIQRRIGWEPSLMSIEEISH